MIDFISIYWEVAVLIRTGFLPEHAPQLLLAASDSEHSAFLHLSCNAVPAFNEIGGSERRRPLTHFLTHSNYSSSGKVRTLSLVANERL